MSDTPNNPDKTIQDLCTLVEHLSVHQRLMAGKIEELAAHHQQIYAQQNTIYTQIDALFSIFSLIGIRHPLPTMRGWPVSPDFVKILISLILELKPETLVELGSGVSTLVGGYGLEKNGKGRLLSIDHDMPFAEITRRNLVLHGLETVAAVHEAPLQNQVFEGEERIWYAINPGILPDSIDLLVIDGPPASIRSDIRYPSLPFFFDRLSDCAVVLLDDAAREGEKDMVRRWTERWPCFTAEFVDTEKGAVILRKN